MAPVEKEPPTSASPLPRDPQIKTRSLVGAMLLVGSIVAAVFATPTLWQMYLERGDRATMRDQLRRMGVAKWSESCPSRAYIDVVFSGSQSHYYKLTIPPADVDAFLDAVKTGHDKSSAKPLDGAFPEGGNRKSWWQPNEEEQMWLVEFRSAPPSASVVWYVAASKQSGNVYLYRVGH